VRVTAPRVGVLALQGDFACHQRSLAALGATAVRVSLPRDLEEAEALVMPGGESTTMLRLIDATGLREPLERFVRERPVLGTCAGFRGVFIRAPRIRRVGAGVEVIARRGEEPVGVRQGRTVGIAFHPELTQDLRLHRWFLEQVAGFALPATAGAGVEARLRPR